MILPYDANRRPDGIFGKDRCGGHNGRLGSLADIRTAICRIANIALIDAITLPYDAPRPEQVADERPECVQDLKHRYQ
jgi:hypothetical protein